MPLYEYSCSKCDPKSLKPVTVIHTMAELDNPSSETIEEITCHCTKKGTRMERCYVTAPAIKTPTSKIYMDKDRKKRNKNHFKKEILPTLGRDEQIHHAKKDGKNINTRKLGLVG